MLHPEGLSVSRGASVNDGDDVPGCEAQLQDGFKDASARFDSVRGGKNESQGDLTACCCSFISLNRLCVRHNNHQMEFIQEAANELLKF